MVRLTKKKFIKALSGSGGNQTVIAKKCGLSRAAITMFLNRTPEMRELVEDEAERIIDIAENVIDSAITNNKDTDLAKWKLNNSKRGKARGYGAKQEFEHVGNTSMVINLVEKSVEEIKSGKRKGSKSNDKP